MNITFRSKIVMLIKWIVFYTTIITCFTRAVSEIYTMHIKPLREPSAVVAPTPPEQATKQPVPKAVEGKKKTKAPSKNKPVPKY